VVRVPLAKPAPPGRGAYLGRKRRGDPDFLYAATAYAAFVKESRMMCAEATKLHRKSGGSPISANLFGRQVSAYGAQPTITFAKSPQIEFWIAKFTTGSIRSVYDPDCYETSPYGAELVNGVSTYSEVTLSNSSSSVWHFKLAARRMDTCETQQMRGPHRIWHSDCFITAAKAPIITVADLCRAESTGYPHCG